MVNRIVTSDDEGDSDEVAASKEDQSSEAIPLPGDGGSKSEDGPLPDAEAQQAKFEQKMADDSTNMVKDPVASTAIPPPDCKDAAVLCTDTHASFKENITKCLEDIKLLFSKCNLPTLNERELRVRLEGTIEDVEAWANADYPNVHVHTMGTEERQAWDTYSGLCDKNGASKKDPYDWHVGHILKDKKAYLRKEIWTILKDGGWPMVSQPGKVNESMCYCPWYALSRLYSFTHKETAEIDHDTLGQMLLLIFSDTKKGLCILFSKQENDDFVANINFDDLRAAEANHRSKSKKPKTPSTSYKAPSAKRGNAGLKEELEQTKKELEQTKKELQSASRDVANLKRDNTIRDEDVHRAEEALGRKECYVTSIENQLTKANENILAIHNSLDEATAKRRNAQKLADEAEERVRNLERQASDRELKVSDLERQASDRELKVSDLERQVKTLTCEHQAAERRVGELDDELLQERKSNQRASEKAELQRSQDQAKIGQLQKEVDDLRKANQQQKRRIEQLNDTSAEDDKTEERTAKRICTEAVPTDTEGKRPDAQPSAVAPAKRDKGAATQSPSHPDSVTTDNTEDEASFEQQSSVAPAEQKTDSASKKRKRGDEEEEETDSSKRGDKKKDETLSSACSNLATQCYAFFGWN